MESSEENSEKEINSNNIQAGVKNILITLESEFPVHTIVSGSYGPMRIEYAKGTIRTKGSTLLILSLRLLDPESDKKIASRDLNFYLTDEDTIHADGRLVTEEKHQSRGYGTGLMLTTDDVMEDAMNRYEKLKGKRVLLRIADSSHGVGTKENGDQINRKKWSSHLAEKMGFEQIKKGIWQKAYGKTESSK